MKRTHAAAAALAMTALALNNTACESAPSITGPTYGENLSKVTFMSKPHEATVWIIKDDEWNRKIADSEDFRNLTTEERAAYVAKTSDFGRRLGPTKVDAIVDDGVNHVFWIPADDDYAPGYRTIRFPDKSRYFEQLVKRSSGDESE